MASVDSALDNAQSRLGVFSAPGSIFIGDEFSKKSADRSTYRGKQFLGSTSPAGPLLPTSLIEKRWKYLAEGDLYVDPGRWDRRHAMDERKKQITEKAFKPVAPPRHSFGIFPHKFEEDPSAGKQPKEPFTRHPPKPMYTVTAGPTGPSPMWQRGKMPDYMPDPLEAGDLDKLEKKKARELIAKPFGFASKSFSRTGLFSTFDYQPEGHAKAAREKLDKKPFKPSSPAKKGPSYFGTVAPFPEHIPDPEDVKIQARRDKLKAELEAARARGYFKPGQGPKSLRTTTINPYIPQNRPDRDDF